jgi:hypothetical protein
MIKDDAAGLVVFGFARLVGRIAAALRGDPSAPPPAGGGRDGR